MRCISPHARYSIQIIEGNEQVGLDARGTMHSIQLSQPQIANFEQGGMTEWEIEAALMAFNFAGVPDGVNPLTRVGVFDSEAFVQHVADEDERRELLEKIDKRLRFLQERHPSEFIIVEKPASPLPWPSYDGDTIQEIIEFQKRLGISPEQIRLYEVENQNRQAVIDVMTDIENGAGGELEVVSVEEAITVNA